MVPACNRGYDPLYSAVSLKYHTAGISYDIPTRQIILAMDQSVVVLNYPLLVDHYTKELQLPI